MIPPTHPLFKNLTGQRFFRLTVVEYAGRIRTSHAYRCRCECGGEIVTRGYSLTGGVTKSCGCLLPDRNKEVRTTHGLSHSKEWRIWAGMKNRCYNETVRGYQNYGGRGIVVCDRWLTGDGVRGGFECFYSDIGPRPSPSHSIDRINNDGNYEPGNCRWATTAEQSINTRTIPRIEWRGWTLSAHEWAAATGIPASQIEKRIGRGWSADRALTQPLRRSRR